MGGYAVSGSVVQVPASVVTAMSLQIAFLLQRLNAAQLGLDESEKARASQSKFSISPASGLILEAESLLYEYKVPLVGRR